MRADRLSDGSWIVIGTTDQAEAEKFLLDLDEVYEYCPLPQDCDLEPKFERLAHHLRWRKVHDFSGEYGWRMYPVLAGQPKRGSFLGVWLDVHWEEVVDEILLTEDFR